MNQLPAADNSAALANAYRNALGDLEQTNGQFAALAAVANREIRGFAKPAFSTGLSIGSGAVAGVIDAYTPKGWGVAVNSVIAAVGLAGAHMLYADNPDIVEAAHAVARGVGSGYAFKESRNKFMDWDATRKPKNAPPQIASSAPGGAPVAHA